MHLLQAVFILSFFCLENSCIWASWEQERCLTDLEALSTQQRTRACVLTYAAEAAENPQLFTFCGFTARKLQLCCWIGEASCQILPGWDRRARPERWKPNSDFSFGLAADEKVWYPVLPVKAPLPSGLWASPCYFQVDVAMTAPWKLLDLDSKVSLSNR